MEKKGRETRRRLLWAAEKLFAERGYETTSIRQITIEADANIAAVHYHFGGKKEILEALFTERILPIEQERLERLDKLEQSNKTPSVEDIILTFLTPLFLRESDTEHFATGSPKLIRQLLDERPSDLKVPEQFKTFRQSMGRYLQAFHRALPHLTLADLLLRLRLLVNVISEQNSILKGMPLPNGDIFHIDLSKEQYLHTLVTFLAAGFRASSTLPLLTDFPADVLPPKAKNNTLPSNQ